MKNLIINAPFFKEILEKDKLIVVDGGAKGELFKPFNQVDKSVFTVLRFEPNSETEVITDKNEIVFNKALWNYNGTITINIAKEPSTSSVLAIDERILKQVDPAGIELRRTVKKVEVDCTTIDSACENNNVPLPDFIKLDIHGSEFEALEGAAKCLQNTAFGALVETWTLPIHKGQKTHGEVEALLNKFGLFLFEYFPLMQWTRQAKGAHFHKVQAGGWDALFFKDIIETDFSRQYTNAQAVKSIALADLFGHHAYALQLAAYFHEIKTIDANLYNKTTQFILAKKGQEIRTKWLQKVWLKSNILLTRFTG